MKEKPICENIWSKVMEWTERERESRERKMNRKTFTLVCLSIDQQNNIIHLFVVFFFVLLAMQTIICKIRANNEFIV